MKPFEEVHRRAPVIELKLNPSGVYEMKTSTKTQIKNVFVFIRDLLFKNSLKYGAQAALMFASGLTLAWAFAPVFFGFTIISPTVMGVVWLATGSLVVLSMTIDAVRALDFNKVKTWFRKEPEKKDSKEVSDEDTEGKSEKDNDRTGDNVASIG